MAIYKFITDKDLDVGMKKYFRDQITNGATNIHILKTTEAAAFDIIKAKLNNKYNLVLLFPSIQEWSAAKPYLKDEYTYKSDKIYKALLAGTNQDPAAVGSTYWVEEDPRVQLLVVFCVAITLYFFTESIAPNKLTEDIVNGFTNAMEWLEEVKKGTENPDWPLAEEGSSFIHSGSNAKIDHYY